AEVLGHADGLVGLLGVGGGTLDHVGEVRGHIVVLVILFQEGAVQHQHKVAAGDVALGIVLAVGAFGDLFVVQEVHGVGSPAVGGSSHVGEHGGLGLLGYLKGNLALIGVLAIDIIAGILDAHFAIEAGARHKGNLVQIHLRAG